MIDNRSRSNLLAAYYEWAVKRERLAALEETGPVPDADEWATSDDVAVQLLREFAEVVTRDE